MTVFKPREYQREALEAVRKAWSSGMERPVVLLPTGAGKTVIFAHLAEQRQAEGRVLILVHRDELVRQTVDKVRSIATGATVGVVKAAENEVDADVVVASVQTLSRTHRMEQVKDVHTIIVDECHHAVADSYLTILHHFGAFDGVATVGFTATLARGDARGLGKVWSEIVYRKTIMWMIEHGYLVDVRAKTVVVEGLNLAGVSTVAGDFSASGLTKALDAVNAAERVAEVYTEHAGDRQGILFTPGVEASLRFADAFCDAGIATTVVVGSTPTEERKEIFDAYRAGELQAIASAMVLTEGFDMPQAEVAVIARPTKSSPLFQQMVGRVLRPSPGKADALVLDVAGVAGKHRLASLADLSQGSDIPVAPRDGESLGEALIRQASEMGEVGKLRLKEISLFQASPVNWLTTYKGIRFVQTRFSTFFLLRNGDGTFKVGQCGADTVKGGRYHHDSITLDYGMALIEELVMDDDPMVGQKDRAWRKVKKPSEPQERFAKSLGVWVDGMRKAECSDAISVALVSRLLDR